MSAEFNDPLILLHDEKIFNVGELLPNRERDGGDVPPLLSSATIWSPIPIDKEIGREEAIYR